MMKISFQEACDQTINWLTNNGITATRMSYIQFIDIMSQFCKRNGFEVIDSEDIY